MILLDPQCYNLMQSSHSAMCVSPVLHGENMKENYFYSILPILYRLKDFMLFIKHSHLKKGYVYNIPM